MSLHTTQQGVSSGVVGTASDGEWNVTLGVCESIGGVGGWRLTRHVPINGKNVQTNTNMKRKPSDHMKGHMGNTYVTLV